MKYVILLADGMADHPCSELGGKTPLEYARTPYMDWIAAKGTQGLIDTIPKGLPPGSDVANLSVLGYDPAVCFTGRGPLEAANMGLDLSPVDVAFRCNLVTLGPKPDQLMEDFTAGHITSAEGEKIVETLQAEFGRKEFSFYPGVSYRHIMVWRRGIAEMRVTPPHDITGQASVQYLPNGPGSEKVINIMRTSQDVLAEHPINKERVDKGLRPANAIWLWGQGHIPKMRKIHERYKVHGGMISAVDLLNGIAVYAGLEILHVAGATGYTDTNYTGKGQKALEALRDLDLVFIHVEAPDEMGHEGNLSGKIQAIEDFDEKVVGTILKDIGSYGPFRVAVLSDHPTPLEIKTHTGDPSPIAVFSSIEAENQGRKINFGETQAKGSGNLISPGHDFLDLFIRYWSKFTKHNRL
jgi:2,3-bisphosphoglycerate-independent phosphoglycerate mutase